MAQENYVRLSDDEENNNNFYNPRSHSDGSADEFPVFDPTQYVGISKLETTLFDEETVQEDEDVFYKIKMDEDAIIEIVDVTGETHVLPLNQDSLNTLFSIIGRTLNDPGKWTTAEKVAAASIGAGAVMFGFTPYNIFLNKSKVFAYYAAGTSIFVNIGVNIPNGKATLPAFIRLRKEQLEAYAIKRDTPLDTIKLCMGAFSSAVPYTLLIDPNSMLSIIGTGLAGVPAIAAQAFNSLLQKKGYNPLDIKLSDQERENISQAANALKKMLDFSQKHVLSTSNEDLNAIFKPTMALEDFKNNIFDRYSVLKPKEKPHNKDEGANGSDYENDSIKDKYESEFDKLDNKNLQAILTACERFDFAKYKNAVDEMLFSEIPEKSMVPETVSSAANIAWLFTSSLFSNKSYAADEMMTNFKAAFSSATKTKLATHSITGRFSKKTYKKIQGLLKSEKDIFQMVVEVNNWNEDGSERSKIIQCLKIRDSFLNFKKKVDGLHFVNFVKGMVELSRKWGYKQDDGGLSNLEAGLGEFTNDLTAKPQAPVERAQGVATAKRIGEIFALNGFFGSAVSSATAMLQILVWLGIGKVPFPVWDGLNVISTDNEVTLDYPMESLEYSAWQWWVTAGVSFLAVGCGIVNFISNQDLNRSYGGYVFGAMKEMLNAIAADIPEDKKDTLWHRTKARWDNFAKELEKNPAFYSNFPLAMTTSALICGIGMTTGFTGYQMAVNAFENLNFIKIPLIGYVTSKFVSLTGIAGNTAFNDAATLQVDHEQIMDHEIGKLKGLNDEINRLEKELDNSTNPPDATRAVELATKIPQLKADRDRIEKARDLVYAQKIIKAIKSLPDERIFQLIDRIKKLLLNDPDIQRYFTDVVHDTHNQSKMDELAEKVTKLIDQAMNELFIQEFGHPFKINDQELSRAGAKLVATRINTQRVREGLYKQPPDNENTGLLHRRTNGTTYNTQSAYPQPDYRYTGLNSPQDSADDENGVDAFPMTGLNNGYGSEE